MQLTKKNRIIITAIVTLLVWGHLVWDHFHGGVPSHYLLHNKDLPSFSNWWGGLLLPMFTWLMLYRIQQRLGKPNNQETMQKVGLRFLGGLVFALAIAICFVQGINITDYIMGAIFVLAFIFPLYKAEYFLGWVLGSAFTFGAVLPIGFGSVLCLLFFLIYSLVQWVRGLVLKNNSKTQP